MATYSHPWFPALVAAGLALSGLACTQGDFAGTADRSNSANLRGKGDAADGDDTDGGPDSDAGDSDSDSDSGNSDSDGDSDSDAGGVDSDGDAGGDSDSDGDGSDTDGLGDDGATINPEKDPSGFAESDDENKKKYLHDAVVNRTKADDKFTLLIETLIKGEVVQSSTLTFGAKGQAAGGGVAKLACRTGSKKNTCLRLTFTGKVKQIVGSSSCTKVRENSGHSATVHADTNGKALIGDCNVGDDELVEISCPKSKTLKVENCNS